MNKEISNQKIEVEEGIELNDKDYINDLLTTLKCMVKDYTVALTEVSNETLFSKYKKMYDDLLQLQRETFETMFRCGFYKLEEIDTTKITEKYQTLSQEKEKIEGE
ncbi:MAG: spore coat protein [Bacilli bacterium]|mgnify:FL=1|jgi:spore coat protein CotF|nr:spore coat protein [Bacilli bacterium]